MKRRKHPPEFKLKVVKEAIEIGNCSLAARKYNLSKGLVSKWVRTYKNAGEQNFLEGKTSTDTNTYSSQEYKEMAKENEKLKKLLGEKELEIEILRDLLKKTNPHLKIK